MHRHYRTAVLASIGALMMVGAWVLLRGRDAEPIQVTTEDVTHGSIVRRIVVSGTLQPARTVALGSQVSGTIQSIEADFNSPVRAGQIVAHLDPSVPEAQLAEASARVAQSRGEHARLQAVVDDARTKLAHAEQLAAGGQIPAAELDAARVAEKEAAASLKATAADIAGAQAMVTQARVSLDHTTIRSPIDGIVIGRHVDVGQTVKASVETPVLFTVADLRRMQLLAEIDEADVAHIRPGSSVTFQVESIGHQPFEGSVAAIRLQPLLAQGTQSASGGSAPTPAPIGTSGAAGSAGSTTTPSTQPSGTSSPTSSGTRAPVPGSPGPTSGVAPPATSGSTASQASGASPATGSVVTYIAVIDVNNANGAIPPGGTAMIALPGDERRDVVRIPNNALTFRPSAEALAAVAQDPPTLDRPDSSREQALHGRRLAHVWKYENRRFIPIAVDVGLSDDSWTELVDGSLNPGDVLLTSAAPTRKK